MRELQTTGILLAFISGTVVYHCGVLLHEHRHLEAGLLGITAFACLAFGIICILIPQIDAALDAAGEKRSA